MAEARVGRIEAFEQSDDPVLEVANCDLIATRRLKLLDLFGQGLHQHFKAGRHVAALGTVGQGSAECIDAQLKPVERIAAAADRKMVDFVGKRLHLGIEPAHRFVGSNMRCHFAQCADGVLELLHRRRVFLGNNEIDLVAERVDCIGVTDQIFRGRQRMQRVAHFSEPVLDASQSVTVHARLTPVRQALGEPLNLYLDRLDSATRHRLSERVADLAKLYV